MEVFELCLIGVLIGVIVYQNRVTTRTLTLGHERSMAAIASIAECAIETVKAANLAEREQVRAARQVNDIQVGQMRDIIEKQANMISKAPKAPEKVRLEDGTEVEAHEYDWGIGV